MNPQGALIGFNALVAAAVAVLVFAVVRFFAATRAAQRRMRDAGSETALLSMALQDAVGKLKAQEREMRSRADASEALSAQIVDSLAAGLLVVGLDGSVRTVNPAGRRLLGVKEPLPEDDFASLLRAHPAVAGLVHDCLVGGRMVPPEDVVLDGATGRTVLSVTVSPLTTGHRQSGAVCLLSDVTPMRELEEQLRLKDTLARLGELTAGIAHEFRNGLATIHGYSRLLKPEQLPGAYRPYVDGIRSEAESLGHVMTNFLKFARPERVQLVPVDLQTVARKALDDLRQDLPADVDVDIVGRFAAVEGDDVLLRQVFGNLIRNAVEACQAHGVPPLVRVCGTVDERTCRVTVDDNGPGIPDAARSRIFEPFFTTRSRGTGLGLAIVQKVVVTLNGRVAAGRAELGGASIQLTFPRRRETREISAA